MNKAQAVLYMFPNADPLKDFEVRDDGISWDWLTPDGKRPTKTVKQDIPGAPALEEGEQPQEGVHFVYVQEFIPDSEMVEGKDYSVIDRGVQITYWNVRDTQGNLVPQPTDEQLQAAWDEMNAPPTEEEILQQAKINKLTELEAARDAELYDGFTSTSVDGTTVVKFGYNPVDQAYLQKLALRMTINPDLDSFDLKSLDHGMVTLTRAGFTQLLNDAANHEGKLEYSYLYLEGQVMNAGSVGAVNAVMWNDNASTDGINPTAA